MMEIGSNQMQVASGINIPKDKLAILKAFNENKTEVAKKPNEDPDGVNLSDNGLKAAEEEIGAKKTGWIQPPDKATMKQVDGILKHFSKVNGVPLELVRAVTWQESHWNPKASSFDAGHGKGLMQIDDRSKEIDILTKKIGLSGFAKSKKVWDPYANVDIGTRYLKELLTKYKGKWKPALKHYNGSWTYADTVMKWVNQKPWKKYM